MAKIRPAHDHEQRASLRLLLAKPEQATAQLEWQISSFLAYVNGQGLVIGPHLVAERDGRLVNTCLAIQSGGRTAMVVVPTSPGQASDRSLVVDLLVELVRQAPGHNLRLLQTLVDIEGGEDESVFADAGFAYLATLTYMDADLDADFKPPPGTPAQQAETLDWTTYSPSTHSLFADTIAATYEGSFDCRGLNGLRSIEDVIDSHKASGQFDPNFWYVAHRQQQPVGVLLLSQVPNRPAWEIVYMGVAPAARGQRIGQALIQKARDSAAAQASKVLTLAVDDDNAFALNLYQANGFRSSGRRRAWIAVIDPHKQDP